MKLRIGTRRSELALWQARFVAQKVKQVCGIDCELVPMSTRGDEIQDRPLAQVGGKGLFVSEIEDALVSGAIEIAVHSLKDMPTTSPDGVTLGCYPRRAPPFDLLCHAVPGQTLATMEAGARIGTGSLRRAAQLRRLRPDIEVVGIRGNVQTRLSKRSPDAHGLAAVVLADAGLTRLGLKEPWFELLEPPAFLPAPGQGILAVQCRSDDSATLKVIAGIDDFDSRIAAAAERACLAAFGGDCHTPLGVFAALTGRTLTLHARLLEECGTATDVSQQADLGLAIDAELIATTLGRAVGQQLLSPEP